MKEFEIEAATENLSAVLAFVDEQLEAADCPVKIQTQIDIAVEEIFVNIAHYAYKPGTGNAVVRVETLPDPPSVDITFIDNGIPYDPLARDDPDITLSADKRPIGGLGIFMVKKTMDDVRYEYLDGHNILTLKKGLVIK
ncbi:MAG: ATP-binding protein [Oscillospiraceae bacterium]|nr:ATP-binding protein [Oscillospiraceae bacterium]